MTWVLNFFRKAVMARANFDKATKKDFIRPEDERPTHGPVYAVNTTASKIIFQGKNNLPAVTLGATPEPDSIAQVEVKMLDTVEFMKLWAKGSIAVSTNPNVAKVYTELELDRQEQEETAKNSVIESIESRDDSSDYEVVDTQTGLPEVKKTRGRKAASEK